MWRPRKQCRKSQDKKQIQLRMKKPAAVLHGGGAGCVGTAEGLGLETSAWK